jgi:hypothetical protein
MNRNYWTKEEIESLMAWYQSHGTELFDVDDFKTAVGEPIARFKAKLLRFTKAPIVVEKGPGQYRVILDMSEVAAPIQVTVKSDEEVEHTIPRFSRRTRKEE